MTDQTDRVVFLDRDGVLNTTLPSYVNRWENYVWYPWTFKALRKLTENGARIFIVTNQSGIGRGYFTAETLRDIHSRVKERVEKAGAHIEEIYYCPHAPEDNCGCRKPQPGMLEQAASEHKISLEKAWFIGDHYTDISAGQQAGVSTILIRSSRDGSRATESAQPDYIYDTLLQAVDNIIEQWRNPS
ncbi:MAG: D-glycero-beta-D-manno-heptose 1,7-bisphosphate 7-phosphatase [Candidatus Marinimicrobia bacterium]|nr:D-glycero-beta-D-manno-heptose 1,7-bisphosphate 7-phosphatase [Candidatus Neomarinimicrobiota bacterium]MCF7827454.1 D-glycero-beta-D-manno-heptose 1,7-bisphosphate 7-phosphatase [Candidatus Neomarinimicrobiota bacterium]MCF7882329.1 D-glycero-beta-D-manno-heptose 1,7-bisphosphate 7-phosphatase [Candidatus Neomarinimicrobiota bacterium]